MATKAKVRQGLCYLLDIAPLLGFKVTLPAQPGDSLDL